MRKTHFEPSSFLYHGRDSQEDSEIQGRMIQILQLKYIKVFASIEAGGISLDSECEGRSGKACRLKCHRI